MGFFSSIIKGITSVVAPIGRAILGLPPPAAVQQVQQIGMRALGAPIAAAGAGIARTAAATGRAAVGVIRTPAGALGVGAAVGAAGTRILTPSSPGAAVGAAMVRGAGGNGQFVRQTIVETIDLASNTVVRQLVFDGAPFLMNNEVRRLRTVAKKLGRANARLPRRTVKESAVSQLKDAAVRNALDNIGKCP